MLDSIKCIVHLRANFTHSSNQWGPSDKMYHPYRLVHSPSHFPQSQCLHFYHFISVNFSSGIWEERQSTGSFFEMPKRMNSSHYSHWVMNNVLTWQLTVMYHPSSYMWHIEMIGVTSWSDGFCSIEGAYVQWLNCRVEYLSQGWSKSKIKGVWSLTVSRLWSHQFISLIFFFLSSVKCLQRHN